MRMKKGWKCKILTMTVLVQLLVFTLGLQRGSKVLANEMNQDETNTAQQMNYEEGTKEYDEWKESLLSEQPAVRKLSPRVSVASTSETASSTTASKTSVSNDKIGSNMTSPMTIHMLSAMALL